MRNKTANIYTEWLPLIESLQDDVAGKVFKCILKYQNGEDIDSQNPIWLFIKSKLDEFNDKYANIAESRRNAGSKGGVAKASKCQQKLAKDSKSKQNLANVAIKENKIKQNKIKQNKIKEISIDNIVDWDSLFNYWEQNKEGGKYKNDDSRNRMLVKLKSLTNEDFELAKEVIFDAIDHKWQGFCGNDGLYYKKAKPDAVELYLQIDNQKREEQKRLASAAEKAMELARQKAMSKFGG